MEYINLSSIQLDVLREIGNIGAGNAATSMSKLVHKKIEMQVPSVKIVNYDEMMDLIGGPEELIAAMLFQVKGEVPSSVYFILSMEEAETLVRAITKDNELSLTNNIPNELAISALQELGNIVTGSYLSALSDFIGLNLQPSIPYLSIDMAGAVLTMGLIEISQVSDYAIIIDTSISSESKESIQGHFFLLPEPKSLEKLFVALGVNHED